MITDENIAQASVTITFNLGYDVGFVPLGRSQVGVSIEPNDATRRLMEAIKTGQAGFLRVLADLIEEGER